MLTVDLLRHGALEGGVKYRGKVDDPLTIEGRQAMDRVWAELAGDVDCIITSPLSRCVIPASLWAAEAGIDCMIEPRLAEMDYGAWEGKSIDDIRLEYPGMIERWRADPTGMRPPGGESPEELRTRLYEWWEDTRRIFDGRHLLVVAHSGSLRMLIALLLDQPISYTRTINMPYACRNRILHQQGGSRLIEMTCNGS
ncbi:MAG: histidine phosphatase family protein [Mariprofundus sp.]